ncbi:hypothetical protein [Clostridium formicaceticum]|uniref:N-acetyltransferase domain-containing protein n=1 Tax=Clostridium formicaceticum TaxID=1497 RepID=A0AAC9RKW7_9CLOT|nr:hypothetical protein [Clostridium formicaceticum]AOY76968.1 hypothetical protein BJL90_14550 [Clostridium formicaceticum]ARE87452.1 hypothetical protein CLFO_18520 [Clostridium formicaceticum]
MEKKVEIKLPQALYKRLEEQSKSKNLALENYIVYLLQEGEYSKDQVQHFKKIVISDMQNMIYKVQKFNLNPSNKFTNKEISCIPLEIFKHPLSEDLSKKIDFLKKQKFFKENYFYLLINNEEVVGYTGLDFFEEPMPYGQYGFIYCLHVEKSYQTYKNLKNIFSFLQSIIKDEKFYNMDLSTSNCNIAGEALVKLGFKEFCHVKQVYGSVKTQMEYDTILQYRETEIDLNKWQIQNLLPVNRISPIAYLQEHWKENREAIRVKSIQYNQKVEAFILQESKTIQGKKYLYYSIFLNPLDVYDRDVLKEIYHIFIKDISIKALSDAIIMDIPIEIEGMITQYIDAYKEKSIYWYRKML